jgi:hypothetical protein
MSGPQAWRSVAFNPVPESENRIHADDVAHAYGFRGGLVPGVVVSAYLLHPAAVAWERAWAERGSAHVVVHSPVYDGEAFEVVLDETAPDAYTARLIDARGAHCATATARLLTAPPAAPQPRRDALLARDHTRPLASRDAMEALRASGMGAMPARWNADAEITRYLRDAAGMAPVYRDAGLANPAFVLGLTNWVLGRNVQMSPWLHLQTDSQHYRCIEQGCELYVEAAVADLFEKKGHEFVDADVAVFRCEDDAAVASIRLRAIYKLRPAARGDSAPAPGDSL